MINFLFILLLIVVFFYIAMIYTSEALLLLAFSSVVLVVLAFLFLLVQGKLLKEKLLVPIAVVDAGNAVTVQVQIINRGIFSCSRVKMAMEVKNSFERKRSRFWVKASNLLPGENVVEYSMILDGAGNYEVRLYKLCFSDLTGIFMGKKRARSRKNIQVLPKIHEVGIQLTQPVRNFFGDADIYDEEKAGHDNSEIFQIRPFMEGDRLQGIHWKLSARMDELMVKESSLPKACPVVILLDYRYQRRGAGNTGSFLEIGAALSFSLMDAGCPHYVAWYEEQTKEVTRIRVDDEESFYLFFSYYLKEQGRKPPENLLDCYDEKYRAEHYLYSLHLTGTLSLYKNKERICRFKNENLRQQLGGLEIVL